MIDFDFGKKKQKVFKDTLSFLASQWDNACEWVFCITKWAKPWKDESELVEWDTLEINWLLYQLNEINVYKLKYFINQLTFIFSLKQLKVDKAHMVI